VYPDEAQKRHPHPQLQASQVFSRRQGRTRVVQVADALWRIHELRLANGDSKPENILSTRDGIPELADFGSAKAIGGSVPSKVPLTSGYATPEHFGGQAMPESDVCSLALAPFEATTGRSLLPDPGEYERGRGYRKKVDISSWGSQETIEST